MIITKESENKLPILFVVVLALAGCGESAAPDFYEPVYQPPLYHNVDLRPEFSEIRDIAMGATWNGEKKQTTFRFFSPYARAVDLVLYASADTAYNATGEGVKRIPMEIDGFGVWSVATKKAGPVHNPPEKYRYYRYLTTGLETYPGAPDLKESETYLPDPYARAVDTSLGHSLVVDPEAFSWNEGNWPANKPGRAECVVYEVSVADFTGDDSTPSVAAGQRGTFPGMEARISYLKNLGVTCVELMPVMEFAVDDPGNEDDYSWGYLPTLFFAPESSYATASHDGRQVDQLKSLIAAFHRSGIRVILDIVPTHTSNTYNFLYWSEPQYRYYFVVNQDKSWGNVGTGNWLDAGENKPFARKLVLDMIRYWIEEYRVDGFRFDLAPGIYKETLQEVLGLARQLYPDIFLTAENWWGANRHDWLAGSGISQWNDFFREAGRNFLWANDNVNGDAGALTVARLKAGVYFSKGVSDVGFDRALDPLDTLNYLESHDESTVACYTSTQPMSPVEEHCVSSDIASTSKSALGAVLLLTSQGTPMLYEGQEILRIKAKQNQSREANLLDWNLVGDQATFKNFITYLNHLRADCPALRMTTDPDTSGGSFINFIDYDGSPGDGSSKGFGYQINVFGQADACRNSGNSTNTAGATSLLVLLNMNAGMVTYTLPGGTWIPIAASTGGANNTDCGNQVSATLLTSDGVDSTGDDSDIDHWSPSGSGQWGVACYSAVVFKKQ